MPLLLVDDRDGRVVAEIETGDEALRIMEALAGDQMPEYLCLVDRHSKQGSFVGTDTSIKVRSLR